MGFRCKNTRQSGENTPHTGRGKKKWQTNIAPLQPLTLATFRSWGNSAGAGRAGLPGAKVHSTIDNRQSTIRFFRSLAFPRKEKGGMEVRPVLTRVG